MNNSLIQVIVLLIALTACKNTMRPNIEGKRRLWGVSNDGTGQIRVSWDPLSGQHYRTRMWKLGIPLGLEGLHIRSKCLRFFRNRKLSTVNGYPFHGLDGTAIKTLFGHQGDVSTLDFSADGKTLATGSFDKTIKLWNLEKNSLTWTFRSNFQAIFYNLS